MKATVGSNPTASARCLPISLTDAAAMALALAQARHALERGDVPVGAVALVDGRPVVASGTTSVS